MSIPIEKADYYITFNWSSGSSYASCPAGAIDWSHIQRPSLASHILYHCEKEGLVPMRTPSCAGGRLPVQSTYTVKNERP